MAEMGNFEDMKTAAIALLLQQGGSVEMPFETLGEATVIVKAGDATVVVERTATGIRYAIAEAASARARRVNDGGGRA